MVELTDNLREGSWRVPAKALGCARGWYGSVAANSFWSRTFLSQPQQRQKLAS